MLCIINGERFRSKTKNKIAENKNADAILVNPQKNKQEKTSVKKNAAAKVRIPLVFFI